MRRHRRAGDAAAPRRSAGDAGEAQPDRFRVGDAARFRTRRPRMSVLVQPTREERADIKAQVTAAHTSFYWAMRFLPKPRREAMFAIYAFCRAVDDIVDSGDPPMTKLAALAGWRRAVDAFYAGQAGDALTRALADAAEKYRLRRIDFIGVIEGMEMDARATIRAPSLAELDLYCDRAASAVGRLSARIFGAPGDHADRVANALGRALQLTNILRDLAEDGARGRLYLPRELLERHGIAAREPAAVLTHPNRQRSAQPWPPWRTPNSTRRGARWPNVRAARCGRRR